MSTIYTEIEIDAPIEQVWESITGFAEYPRWNPFIVAIEGQAQSNEQITIKIQMKNKLQVFTPDIVHLQAPYKLEWIGKIPGGAFKGHHCFHLSTTSKETTKLVHFEDFSGWLKPLILWMIGADTKRGFESMNLALKQHLEHS